MIAVVAGLDAPGLDQDRDRDRDPETPPKKRGGGPRTPEGKERSKRNALRHGMLAKQVFPGDMAAAIAARTAELVDEFGPETPYEEWLVGEMAKASTKIDRCGEMAIVDLQRIIDRAGHCWDRDRRGYVEDLGARLAKDPARVAWALEGTKQGADWMLLRWQGLGEVLQARGGWDEAQRRLAFDLLGVPHELRDGSLKVPPEADAEALAGLVKAQVARLREELEESLIDLDEATQAMAAGGMPFEEDAATARLRKYDAASRKAWHWAHAELRRARAGSPRPGDARPAERPIATGAASEYQIERAKLIYPAIPVPEAQPHPERPAVAEEPTAVTHPAPVARPTATVARPPVVVPTARASTSSSMSMFSTSTGNRRERRAQAKLDRQAERRGTR
jgi:hypothetical protein